MFQFFTSFGASTGFERCRLEITAKTWDGPSEQAIRSTCEYIKNRYNQNF